jgi:hypothetical protein
MANRIAKWPRRAATAEKVAARQELRNQRTDMQQLQLLEKKGHGHCKEAKKLRERLGMGEG